jgi:hypothetical protein
MAHLQFTDVQDRPTEFLDLTSVTLDEFQLLVGLRSLRRTLSATSKNWRSS